METCLTHVVDWIGSDGKGLGIAMEFWMRAWVMLLQGGGGPRGHQRQDGRAGWHCQIVKLAEVATLNCAAAGIDNTKPVRWSLKCPILLPLLAPASQTPSF